MKHEMENAIKLSVKLNVKVKIGPSWGDLQELELWQCCVALPCVGRQKAPWTGQGEGLWSPAGGVILLCCVPTGSVTSCLLKHMVEHGMNSPSQTLQSSVRALKRVYKTVKLLIVKRRVFKWILLKCAWSRTNPQSLMNLLRMKWAGLLY